MGFGARRFLNVLHGCGRILQADFATQDIDQHSLAAGNIDVLQQGRIDGGLGGFNGAVITFGPSRAHHRLAHTLHHRTHVGKIQVNMVVTGNDFVDAPRSVVQHVVGNAERLFHGGARRYDFQQSLVGDDDQGIDGLAQTLDALEGLLHAHRPFEHEGFGDDAHRQGALVAGNIRNNRSGTSTGAATHTCGDKDHVGTRQRGRDGFAIFFGRGTTTAGVTTGTKPFGELGSDLHRLMSRGILESLQVGVDRQELDPGQPRVDHATYRVAAGSADSRHLNIGQSFDFFGVFKHHAPASSLSGPPHSDRDFASEPCKIHLPGPVPFRALKNASLA